MKLIRENLEIFGTDRVSSRAGSGDGKYSKISRHAGAAGRRFPHLQQPGGGTHRVGVLRGRLQCFVLDYTTVTKKPEAVMADPMKDVQDALNWIHTHGEDCCLDTDRIAMIGFSGGGHLAAASATHDPLRPNALVLIYGHNPQSHPGSGLSGHHRVRG